MLNTGAYARRLGRNGHCPEAALVADLLAWQEGGRVACEASGAAAAFRELERLADAGSALCRRIVGTPNAPRSKRPRATSRTAPPCRYGTRSTRPAAASKEGAIAALRLAVEICEDFSGAEAIPNLMQAALRFLEGATA